jgi:hypothetical protein
MGREAHSEPSEKEVSSMVSARTALEWIRKETRKPDEQRMLCELLIASEIVEAIERLTLLIETRLK